MLIREKLGILSVFLVVSCPCVGGISGEIFVSASPTFSVFFLLCSICESYSAGLCFYFSQRKLSVCSCRFSVFVGGGELRILLHHYLELEVPSHNLFNPSKS